MKNKTFDRATTEALIWLTHKIPRSEWYNVAETSSAGVKTIRELALNGVIVIDENGQPSSLPTNITNWIISNFGLNNSKWSNSFHKSWDKVSEASMLELVEEQIVHYFSTYGLESIGLVAMPAIPIEDILTNPDTMPSFKSFTVFNIVSEENAREIADKTLCGTVNPNRRNMPYYEFLIPFVEDGEFLKSFELMCMWCKRNNTAPKQAKDWIRYALYTATGSTLVVNNVRTMKALRLQARYGGKDIKSLFEAADLVALSEEFNRHKKIFLGLKKFPGCASYVNKIAKLSKIHHKPLSGLTIQNIGQFARKGDMESVAKIIEKSSLRQLIKAHNYFIYSTAMFFTFGKRGEGRTELYNIRNGKMFVRENHVPEISESFMQAFDMLDEELCKRIKNKLRGKSFCIPDYITYKAQYTEKQMIGCIPYGSEVHTDGANVFGIYWEDYKGMRTDLDLHLRNETQRFGWNSHYRSDDRECVLFSGDITAAAKGAVEAYSFNPKDDSIYILSVNNFCGENGVPFQFFMTDKGFKLKDNVLAGHGTAVCNVKDAIMPPVPLIMDDRSIDIGIIAKHTFYFTGQTEGSSIVPCNDYVTKALQAQINRMNSMVTINTILNQTDAMVYSKVEDVPEGVECIDLSPSKLTPTTLIELIDSLDN